MIFFFKHVLLVPMIGFIYAIPSIYLFDHFGWLDNLSLLESALVGFVAALVGFIIGNKTVEYRFT